MLLNLCVAIAASCFLIILVGYAKNIEVTIRYGPLYIYFYIEIAAGFFTSPLSARSFLKIVFDTELITSGYVHYFVGFICYFAGSHLYS